VSHPVDRTVTDYVDFTGRTDAVQSVNVIARVTGYLVKIPFKEGAEVKKGDLLFEIDPRPYQAQLDQAKSQVVLYQAQLELAKTTYARYEALDKTTPGAVSKQALDQYRSAVTEAEARVTAQQKSLEVYELNLGFTRVVSPIDGQVSRYYLTVGNLVNQDQTLLTTIVSLDPMYAYFDMDERTLLNIRQAIYEGKITPPGPGADLPVLMGLQNEEGYPHKGTVNFVNNQVNSTTGSITMRGVFPNPKLHPPTKKGPAAKSTTASQSASAPSTPPETPGPPGPSSGAASNPEASRSTPLSPPGGRGQGEGGSQTESGTAQPPDAPRPIRLLSPGMFVRIRLPIGQPHPALLIIDRAIQSDQGLKYVFVLDSENKAQYRRVTTGPLQEDGLRVVTGVEASDLVVVGALQQVRARLKVQPEVIAMPSLGRQTDSEAGPTPAPPAARPKGASPKSKQSTK
jgi:multidrug efflux system membrane fusion protein